MSNADSLAHLGRVAVVGMAARLPGARNVAAFWRNLRDGVESVTFFTEDELAAAGKSPDLLRDPLYVKAGAVLDDVELFDAGFFGINPREAQLMDPQHRFFLECAWEALEDAGCDPERYAGRIGVFASESTNTYFLSNLLARRDVVETFGGLQTVLVNDRDFLATRASFIFNLRGPSLVVQTGCSSSLVGVHLACQSLTSGECDMALAGGVSISLPQQAGYLFQPGGIYSPDGHCRAFDARAGGTVGGNGVGLVVLKRLADALADGDHIHAVIKGSAVNNDGAHKVGYTAPGIDGQARVIAEALAVAGVDPATVGYVEAHGTATPLGDPIEVEALTQAFRFTTAAKQFCALGSVKTNFGHLDAAAGIAGLIKTVLALKHGQIPPSLHYEQPNPEINFAASPFYVNATLKEWPSTPRRAGVSSFGIGGTNAHVVLEEAPLATSAAQARPFQLLLLSARSEAALEAATSNLAQHLAEHADCNLADVAYTLQVGRKSFARRRMLVCRTVEEARRALANPAAPQVVTSLREPTARLVVYLLPGQGSQYVGMGRDLYEGEPRFRRELDRCAELLRPHLDLDVRGVLYPQKAEQAAAERKLNETYITQPALVAVEYALAQVWMSWGVEPQALLGHSLGEYVAACLAGVFTLAEMLALVAARGRLMQQLPAGAMLAVALSEQEVRPLLQGELSLAAVNAPKLCVVAGPFAAVESLQQELTRRGVACRRLRTSHAFHSAMMDDILEAFARQVEGVELHAPHIPFVSSLTGKWITAAEATAPHYWVQQLRQPVRFADGLALLLREPQQVLLEVGAGRTLCSLAGRHPARQAQHEPLASLRDARQQGSDAEHLTETLGRLWLAGVEINWPAVHGEETPRRVSLPSYPFERQRYWVEPAAHALTSASGAAANGDARGVAADSIEQATLPRVEAVHVGAGIAVTGTHAAQTQETVRRAVRSDSRGEVWAQLQALVAELTGVDPAQIDPAASFFELGVDSLLLMQASQAIRKRFGVEISFRQMLEEYPTLAALAGLLETQLPAARHSEPERAASGVARPQATPNGNGAKPTNGTERHGDNGALLVATPRVEQTADEEIGRVESSVEVAEGPKVKIETETFVPFRSIKVGGAEELTEAQARHLNALVARYTARTRQSKELVQTARGTHADSRTALNYRQVWKELVYPIVGERARGAHLWDVDGNEYVDVTMGFGVNLFGHAPPFLVAAIEEQLRAGFALGPQSRLAGEVSRLFCELTGTERVAFCNSGTEAIMSALRLARTATGRDRIAMFAGSYHGSFDGTLARAVADGSGTRAVPLSPGVPAKLIEDVLVLDYDSPGALDIIEAQGAELAAVLVEPVQSRRPDVQPREFLRALRRLTERTGTVLIFDEVITGFRLHPGGAQALFGVRADIATYGKVLGGGVPVGAVAGRGALLDAIDGGWWSFGDASYPQAPQTYYAGTYFKNPLALAAARAVLRHLQESGPALQQELTLRTARLAEEFNAFFEREELPVRVVHCGSLFRFAFARELKYTDLFFYQLIEKGIYIWEGRNCFLSTAHTDADLAQLFRAVEETVAELRAGGFLPERARAVETVDRTSAAHALEPVAGAHRLPLTEGQQQVWLAAQMTAQASIAYNESMSLYMRGPLDLDALRHAIARLVARHEALRTVFSPHGDYQDILPGLTVDVPCVDFSSLAEAERAAQTQAWLAEQARTPFDLVRGPLCRVGVARLEAQYHVFVLTIHHLVMDGWSSGILLRDLKELYAAECEARAARLPAPESYFDYARRLAAQAQSAETQAAENFWLSQFADTIPALDLPTDRPRPPVQTYNGGRVVGIVGDGVSDGLRRLGAQHGCTTFATLLAGFTALLGHLTGQTDIVVGIHSAGQLTSGARDLVGYCINLLPLRARVRQTLTFEQHLAEIRQQLLAVYKHQTYPLGRLLKQLNRARNGVRAPLISVTFNVERTGSKMEFFGLEVEAGANHNGHAKFELSVNVVEGGDELRLEFDYNSDLFDAHTVRRWQTHYEAVLRAVVAAPQISLAALPELLAEADRQQVALREKEFKQARADKLKRVRRRALV
jgi:acyl transferase domain-containing protein